MHVEQNNTEPEKLGLLLLSSVAELTRERELWGGKKVRINRRVDLRESSRERYLLVSYYSTT